MKIQILNVLDGQVSEAEIVKQVGKSKSTISVHLKNLIEDGIVSYKSHPLDRRSKLFYIYADYIGEIYPDKIIYKIPEIESNIDTREELYIEIFRQYKSLLLLHGLQVEPLEVATGENIGKQFYESMVYDTFEELVALVEDKFNQLGLGNLKIASTDPLILKNTGCHECFNLQYNIPTCNVTKGILKGIFSNYYDSQISVDEVECISKYDDSCTFIIEKATQENI
ncbi:MAG: ArsR family transcriptional regulator [Methanosphaera sp.]|nr:ArsR family transcriptional regulator [Methanosphaera sp.]